jgi:hypothetical protein
MIDLEQRDAAEGSLFWSDFRLFALTWAAGFVFTLIFFA